MLTELRNVEFSHYSPLQADMSNYENILTPPSSSEDSPQPMFYQSASPSSSSRSPPPTYLIQQFGLNLNATQLLDSNPYLRILEEPIDKFRFRYKSEMTGTHGSLCGMNSDRSRKQTYPTIELHNWDKPAIVRCSIYQINTKENDKPHPHRLIKKHGKGEADDPHDAVITPETGFKYTFHNMGIIHTAKKNLLPELIKKKSQLKKEEIAREEKKIRPLSKKEEVEIKGLAEAESKSINLNVVCLRFDAFVSKNDILEPICPPVFSHWINNLKSALTGELKIVRMDHCTSPAKGGREIFILVERVTKKNIKIKFYELDDEDNIIWEDYGRFSDLDVHHQYAIVFKTPPYKELNIKSPVKVHIELERPTDHARSEPKEFSYIPVNTAYKPGAKRARTSDYYDNSSYDTSMASDELPATINSLNLGNDSSNPLELETIWQLSSAELKEAANNINSEEFNRLYEMIGGEYQSLERDTAEDRLKKPIFQPITVSSGVKGSRMLRTNYNRQNSVDEVLMAHTVINELRAFIKTHPKDEKIIYMLNHHLNKDSHTNALHVALREHETSSVTFILRMIFVWKQNHLLNMRNDAHESPLHIATSHNLDEIVSLLINCKANVAQVDDDENTALHLAVLCNSSASLFEKLLTVDYVKEFINKENNEGNTPLSLAIDLKNLMAVKLLCRYGADVNSTHKKNGYSPLRLAIEKENVDITRFLLQHDDLDARIEDFQGLNPMHAVFTKTCPELLSLVTDYMQQNGLSADQIKKEVEDFTEEEVEEKFSIKLEKITSEELIDLYADVKDFTPDCLDSVSEVLDQSGTWQDLAEKLDLGHLTRTVLYDTKSSPTKILLKFAIETNGATILDIREFLTNLEESQAVAIMDDMVRTQFTT